MTHRAGVLDHGADGCGIYLNEVKGFYFSTRKQDNNIQAS